MDLVHPLPGVPLGAFSGLWSGLSRFGARQIDKLRAQGPVLAALGAFFVLTLGAAPFARLLDREPLRDAPSTIWGDWESIPEAVSEEQAAIYAAARGKLRLRLPGVEKPRKRPGKPARRWREPDQREVDALLAEAARIHDVPPDLLRAVAEQESRFRHRSRSSAGAIGIMQLMPATARHLGVDPYDPRQNVMGGGAYLAAMLTAFDGDVRLALAAYNAGPAAVRRFGGVPPYAETRAYVTAILARTEGAVPAGF